MPKIIETPPLVSKEMGPQCEKCTHYHDEHNGPNDHCMHIMYYVEDNEVSHKIKKYCPCKEFVEQKLK